MAYPTALNNQVTDAVEQAEAEVIGVAAATAMGNLFLPTSQALGNSAHNAVTEQQQTFEVANAAIVQAVSLLLCADTSSTGRATGKIMNAGKVPVFA